MSDEQTAALARHWALEILFRRLAIGATAIMVAAGVVLGGLIVTQTSDPPLLIWSFGLTFAGLAATLVCFALTVYHSLKN